MHEDIGRRFTTAEMQARWEEQGVEGHNVFANEMVLLNCRVSHIGIVVFTALFQQVFELFGRDDSNPSAESYPQLAHIVGPVNLIGLDKSNPDNV